MLEHTLPGTHRLLLRLTDFLWGFLPRVGRQRRMRFVMETCFVATCYKFTVACVCGATWQDGPLQKATPFPFLNCFPKFP